MQFRPKFITFDCYGTLTRFRMSETGAARSSPAALPPIAWISSCATSRPIGWTRCWAPWKPYDDRPQERGANAPAAGTASPSSRPRASASTTRSRPGTRTPTCRRRCRGSRRAIRWSACPTRPTSRSAPMSRCTARRFHAVFTAEQAQSYKPRMHGFEYMIERLGARPEDLLHVSVFLPLRPDDRARPRHPRQGLGQPRATSRRRTPSTAITKSRTSADFPPCSACRPDETLPMKSDPILARHGSRPFAGGAAGRGGRRGGRGGDRRRLHRPVRGARARRSATRTSWCWKRTASPRGASGRNGGHVNNGTAVDVGDIAARYGVGSRPRPVPRLRRRGGHGGAHRARAADHLRLPPRRQDQAWLPSPRTTKRSPAASICLHGQRRCRNRSRPALRASATRSGSDVFHGGLLHRKSAQMHMGRFGAGLADAALRHGARIYEDAPVTALQAPARARRIA